jgi:hypothetical protein
MEPDAAGLGERDQVMVAAVRGVQKRDDGADWSDTLRPSTSW